jgi:hypothetical protein
MTRGFVVLAAGAAVVALTASPAMAGPPDNASCVGVGASDQAQTPPAGYDNFGQYTSSSVDVNPDPGVSGYVTFFAHIQPCPY